MAKDRIEPTTYWLGNTKKFEVLARVRTHDLLAGKAISEVHFTPWSGDKVEFGQNLQKNASQIMIFLPHLCGRKITRVMIFENWVTSRVGNQSQSTSSHRWSTQDPPVDNWGGIHSVGARRRWSKILQKMWREPDIFMLTLQHLPLRYRLLYFVCFTLVLFVLQPSLYSSLRTSS